MTTLLDDSSAEEVTDSSSRTNEVEVTQPKGFLCKVRLRTEVLFPVSRVYEILTQPDNTQMFRNIKAITYRKVLEDDKHGRQRIELEHEAEWRFLVFGGRFLTRLFVQQDKQAGTLEFKLAKKGMMKDFEGRWHVYTKPQQNHTPAPHPHFQLLRWPFQQKAHPEAQQHITVLELEQSMCPNVIPPPPIDRLLKGIAKRQVCNVVEDLRREIERVKKEEARAAKEPSAV